MSSDPKDNNRHDLTTHHLLELREPPPSLVALRTELAYHPDIVEVASANSTFEGCIATIAEKLDLALDGMYDAEKLCGLLTSLLRCRRIPIMDRATVMKEYGLVEAELVEREGDVTLEKHIPTVPIGTSEVIVTDIVDTVEWPDEQNNNNKEFSNNPKEQNKNISNKSNEQNKLN